MRHIIYLILFLVIASCQSTKILDFQNDVYISKNNGTIELSHNRYRLYELIGNGHTLIYNGFSEGDFRQISPTVLKFDSDRKVSWSLGIEELSLDVSQSVLKTDSIIIKIKNLSEFKSAFDSPIDIKYDVIVNDRPIKEALQIITNNELIIPYKLEDYSIVSLNLQFEFNNRQIFASYNDADFNSNLFEIELPKLKKKDFTYIYLDGEYLLIENDIISWNGQEYIKRSN